MILSFSSSKGGVGKSTAAAAIAGALARDGARVMVFDLDRNRTLHNWYQRGKPEGVTVKALASADFEAEYAALAQQPFDHLLIDTAGVLDAGLMRVFAASELVIIPAGLSHPDAKEAFEMADIARQLGRPFKLLITRAPSIASHVSTYILGEIARRGVPRFEAVMTERTAYKQIFVTGEAPAPTTKAGAEIDAIVADAQSNIRQARKRKAAA